VVVVDRRSAEQHRYINATNSEDAVLLEVRMEEERFHAEVEAPENRGLLRDLLVLANCSGCGRSMVTFVRSVAACGYCIELQVLGCIASLALSSAAMFNAGAIHTIIIVRSICRRRSVCWI